MSLFTFLPACSSGYLDLTMGSTDTLRAEDYDGSAVSGTLDILRDGSISWDGDLSGDDENSVYWSLTGGTPGDLTHVRCSFSSGTNVYLSGDALATWHALSTDRQFNFSKATGGGPELAEGLFTLEFSLDGGTTVHETSTLDIEMFERSP